MKKKLNEASSLVKPGGIYFHYKNPDEHYAVMGVSLSTQTLEQMVIYVALYGAQAVWVRPLSQWLEKINVDGRLIDRFTLIGQMDDQDTCDEDCDGEHCT